MHKALEMHSFDLKIFGIFLIIRLLSVYFVQTSFVPDEYWQALEVSHKMTFGFGYLTWEWQEKIRSCSYPFIFYIMYNILPESTFIIVYVPKILQAILSTFGDFFAFKLAHNLFGPKCALWSVLCIASSWFLFYCSPRTITNMAEASVTICGLNFYPWPSYKKKKSFKYLWFAGASVLLRPTAVVTWLPLYIWHLCREREIFLLLKKTVFIGLINLAAMLVMDRWCFGQWVLTPYNFFLFNWKNDIGAFYGSHNFWWYFVSGFPVILGIQVIPFFLGVFIPRLRHFYYLILWVTLVFSIPSHKEFRFLLPLLHVSLIICSAVLDEIFSKGMTIGKIKIGKNFAILFSTLLLILNIPFSLYMGLYHQRGVTDVVHHLSKTVDSQSHVLFLMPCHSTPFYSYIHKDIEMKFLRCEPNLENNPSYIEEADQFFDNPSQWLSQNYEKSSANTLPTHIVAFDSLKPSISSFLEKHSYDVCYSTFHSHFPDRRTGKFVEIYCKQSSTNKQ